MDQKNLALSVPVHFSKVDGDPHEGTFQKMKVFICSPGKNRNYSYISKEELDAAKPSLAYVPVVGRIYEKIDKNGEVVGYYFGGHDYEVDENFEWRPTTVPYGVMTADEPWYETVTENGKEVEYLCGYCYLWVGRWPELKEAAWDDTFWYAQSMEMSFKDYSIYEEDSNFVEFHGCRFDAICILGYDPDDDRYNTTPCFPSAGFVPVTEFALSTDQFSHLMGELKEQLAESFEHNNDSHQKGGNGLTTEVRDAIFAKFALTMDAVDFEVTEEMTEQELTEKLEAFAAQNAADAGEPAEEPVSDAGEPEGADGKAEFALFSATYREREQMIAEAVSSLSRYEVDEDGNCIDEIWCYSVDFDDTYVYYKANHYTPDKHESKMLRCGYTIGEDNKVSLTGEAEEVFQRWLTQAEIDKIDEDKAQLASLIQFKNDTEKAESDAKVQKLLSNFEDLSSLEEFSEIKDEIEQAEKPDIAQFETRLFALRGKQVKPAAPAQKSAVKVGIDQTMFSAQEDDEYGGLIQRARARKNK